MKKNIGIIFGGKSVEHEVSVITALQVYENIDKSRYNTIPIYIDKKGKWFTHPDLFKYETFKNGNFENLNSAFIKPDSDDNYLYYKTGKFFKKEKKIKIDFYFLLVHGTNGEDGTLQGLMELNNIPYSSCGITGSALGMDKILMKQIFKSVGLPIVDYLWFYRKDWINKKQNIIEKVEKYLKYPVIVKPSNLGSSIGISKVKNRSTLIAAIDVAIQYDLKFIIEKAIEPVREINCSAIGYQNDVEVSMLEEPINWEDFLTFEDKYIRGNKNSKLGGKGGSIRRIIPARIDKEIEKKIKEYTILSFKVLNCSGVVRVDFLVDMGNNVFINEINTIPGSLAYYLWEKRGLDFENLIDKIIEIGFKYHKEKNNKFFNFSANLFKKVDPFDKNINKNKI